MKFVKAKIFWKTIEIGIDYKRSLGMSQLCEEHIAQTQIALDIG
jgi:hypothetical protein